MFEIPDEESLPGDTAPQAGDSEVDVNPPPGALPASDAAPPTTPVKVKQELTDDAEKPPASLGDRFAGLKASMQDVMGAGFNVSPSKPSSEVSAEASEDTADKLQAQPSRQAVDSTGDDAGLCSLCMKKKRAQKSKFCHICRADISAAKREADKQSRGKWFAELMKRGGPDFQDFMAAFIRENGQSRRKYSQRGKFDFIRYEEARRVQTSLRLGYKAGLS